MALALYIASLAVAGGLTLAGLWPLALLFVCICALLATRPDLVKYG